MPAIPEELRIRIALARSKALGQAGGEIPTTSVDDLEPQTLPDGVAPLVPGSTRIPSNLLDRVRAARESALDGLGPAPEHNTVPKENVERVTPERVTIAPASPPSTPQASPAAAPTPQAAEAPAAPAVAAGMSFEQAAGVLGMPEKLLRRSVDAKAKALGVSFDEALAEMLGGTPASTEAVQAPAPAQQVAETPVIEAAVEVTPSPAAAPVAASVSAGMSIEQAAEALGYPEELFRKSVDAKAKALGVSVGEALAGMLGGTAVAAPAPAPAAAAPVAAAPVAASPVVEAAPAAPAPAVAPPTPVPASVAAGMSIEQAAEALGYPEELFRKSVQAKAKALGVSVDEALAGMLGGTAVAAPAPAPAAAAPVVAAPVAASPVAEAASFASAAEVAPPTAVPATTPVAVVASVEEAAAALGMPEKLFRRSVEAKAKALGVSFDQALADMVGASVPAAATAPAAAAPVTSAPAPSAPAPAVPTPAPMEVPEPTEPAAERAEPAAETVESKQLYRIELVTATVSAVILVLLALAGPAPVLRQAGGAADPSMIPWYLVWVAQLLAWIPRETAGFFAPLLVIVGLFAVPFIDRNPSRKPSSRRFALALFGAFLIVLLALTIIGLVNRPGGFGWPWS